MKNKLIKWADENPKDRPIYLKYNMKYEEFVLSNDQANTGETPCAGQIINMMKLTSYQV